MPSIESAAQEFAIWRAATAARWQATYAEIAETVGLPLWTVSRICIRKGWNRRLDAREAERSAVTKCAPAAVDTYMDAPPYWREHFAADFQ